MKNMQKQMIQNKRYCFFKQYLIAHTNIILFIKKKNQELLKDLNLELNRILITNSLCYINHTILPHVIKIKIFTWKDIFSKE